MPPSGIEPEPSTLFGGGAAITPRRHIAPPAWYQHAGHFPSFRAVSNRKRRCCRSVWRIALRGTIRWQSRQESNLRSGSQSPLPYPLATALYKPHPYSLHVGTQPSSYGQGIRFSLRGGLWHFTEKHRIGLPYLCYSLPAGRIPHPHPLRLSLLAGACAWHGCLILSPLYITDFGTWSGEVGVTHHASSALSMAAPSVSPSGPRVYAAGQRISRQRLQTISHPFASTLGRSQARKASATH